MSISIVFRAVMLCRRSARYFAAASTPRGLIPMESTGKWRSARPTVRACVPLLNLEGLHTTPRSPTAGDAARSRIMRAGALPVGWAYHSGDRSRPWCRRRSVRVAALTARAEITLPADLVRILATHVYATRRIYTCGWSDASWFRTFSVTQLSCHLIDPADRQGVHLPFHQVLHHLDGPHMPPALQRRWI